MPRGQYQRKAVVPAPPSETPQRPFAVLVEALPQPEPEPTPAPTLTLSEMLADAIRAETSVCAYDEAGALSKVAVCLGELRRALAATQRGGDLGDALARIAALI